MPIATTCPKCEALFRLPDELAGRTVKCQKCAGLFVAPMGGLEAMMPAMPVLAGVEPALVERPLVAVGSAAPPTVALPPLPSDRPTPPPLFDAGPEAEASDKPPANSPKRSEESDEAKSRPRRIDKAKPASRVGMIVGVLGLIALAMIVCGVGTGIWHFASKDRPRAGLRGIKKREAPPPMEFNPGFNPNGPAIPNLPDFDGFKDGKIPEPPTECPPGAVRVIFDMDGKFRHQNAIALDDPKNQMGTRHKLYIIRLEAGKTYQIDMTSPNPMHLDPYLYLRDAKGNWCDENDDIDQGKQRNARIIYKCQSSGTYHLEASYWQPQGNQLQDGMLADPAGPFTLIIRHVKDNREQP